MRRNQKKYFLSWTELALFLCKGVYGGRFLPETVRGIGKTDEQHSG